ncbi:MAG: class I SAM-dependent methyltransferase [Candidatus Diapherotrites archaeon]
MKDVENTHWWFVSKRQLLIDLVPKGTKSIFEIGAGTGNTLEAFMLKGYSVEGLDINKIAVNESKKKNVLVYLSSLENFKPQKKYDFIVMSEILEHIKDDAGAIKKAKKIMKKNSRLLLTIPAFKILFSAHDRIGHHYRRYEKKEILKLLKKEGFEIELISYWNFFLFPIIALIKILNEYVLKIHIKSDINTPNKKINFILTRLLKTENWLIKKGVYLPFGISLICIAKIK